MTNKEAKVFLDNLKICVDEHPVVADWLVEIADRKIENSSEIPNNCEPQIEYCPRCGMRILVSKLKDEPQTDCAWK